MPDELDEGAEGERWLSAEMECAVCGFQWVAVYPESAPSLQCKECGYMNARHDELANN